MSKRNRKKKRIEKRKERKARRKTTVAGGQSHHVTTKCPRENLPPCRHREQRAKSILGDVRGCPDDPLAIAEARQYISASQREALDLYRKHVQDFQAAVASPCMALPPNQTKGGGIEPNLAGIERAYRDALAELNAYCSPNEVAAVESVSRNYGVDHAFSKNRAKLLVKPSNVLLRYFNLDINHAF